MKPIRPTRWQEIMRQWILLIPLATAVVGTLAISVGRDEIWVDYLPPLFFVGALLVTAAMMHQRHMLNTNWQLNDQLQGANSRLDTLHYLTVDLNKSLELDSVAEAVLKCACQALGAQAGALWLRVDLLPPDVQKNAASFCIPLHTKYIQKSESEAWRGATLADDAELSVASTQWCCIAARGFENHTARLAAWDDQLESGHWSGEILAHGLLTARASHRGRFEVGDLWQDVAQRAPDNQTSEHDVIEADANGLGQVFAAGENAAVVPILWKNKVVGALLSASWNATAPNAKPRLQRAKTAENVLRESDVLMLRDIALMAGPSLQNSLRYGAATSRAQIDALTGLHNHRVLQERLTQEVARATRAMESRPLDARPPLPMAVAVMDVTDFKLFNDTYGHSTGDNVLKFIATCLRHTFRAGDVVARYGGDEFVVVLPDTDLSSAQSVCRRAQDAVLAQPFEAPDGSQVSVRVSCGVAVFPHDGTDTSTLLAKADERLYEAKALGRLIVENAPSVEAEIGEHEMGIWREFPVYKALVEAIDKKDRYTRRHTRAVFGYANRIALALQLPPAQMAAVQGAALLHDIGKIVVPDAILRKPGRLSAEETEIMQRHVLYGEQLVKDVPEIEGVLDGVRHHHENFDGSGYPSALSGSDIPLVARLLAVPDAFVAMTIERPYRRALSKADAMRQIEIGSGTQFDPDIVRAFAEIVRNEV